MFSILVEEAFEISNRIGIILLGKTSGVIRIGDYLHDVYNRTYSYKVIGLEMTHDSNIEKQLTHNPGIMIEAGDYEPSEFKGKTLQLS